MRDDIEHAMRGSVRLIGHFVHCQRDAIDRNRAFRGDIWRQRI